MMKPVICLLAACALLGLPVQLQALPTAQTNEVADIEAVNVYCPQRPGLGYSVAAALGWLQYISPGFFFDLRCTHTATVITIRTAITVVNVGIENRYGRACYRGRSPPCPPFGPSIPIRVPVPSDGEIQVIVRASHFGACVQIHAPMCPNLAAMQDGTHRECKDIKGTKVCCDVHPDGSDTNCKTEGGRVGLQEEEDCRCQELPTGERICDPIGCNRWQGGRVGLQEEEDCRCQELPTGERICDPIGCNHWQGQASQQMIEPFVKP